MLFKQVEPLLQFQIEAGQYGADTMAVTKSVEQVLRELGPVLETEKIVLTPDLFRPADFITAGIGHLRTALMMGGVLVVLLLLVLPVFAARYGRWGALPRERSEASPPVPAQAA